MDDMILEIFSLAPSAIGWMAGKNAIAVPSRSRLQILQFVVKLPLQQFGWHRLLAISENPIVYIGEGIIDVLELLIK